MGGRDAVPSVLDQVQMLDEQVAVTWAVPQQGADLVKRDRFDLPPLRLAARYATAGAGVAATPRWLDVR